jgi:hypothetical protein
LKELVVLLFVPKPSALQYLVPARINRSNSNNNLNRAAVKPNWKAKCPLL